MDVSVVIVNYNTFELTCACIKSIHQQTHGLAYEVILVDNCSTERAADDFLTIFPELILIKSATNVGFAKGCNLGVREARGTYVLLLNSDTTLENNAIGITWTFLQNNPNVAVVSARLAYPDGQVQHNCQRFPSVRYGLFELFRIQKFLPRPIGGKILFGPFFDYESIAFPDWVWGTFFLFPKTYLTVLPEQKLADDFFMYGEDMLWCKQFIQAGYRIAFHPDARVIHYMGKSGGPKKELMIKNEKIFMERYYSRLQIRIISWLTRMLTGTSSF